MNLVRVSKSCVGSDEITSVATVLNRGFLGMGSEVQAFESELQDYFGSVDYKVVCVNTGTAALQLALQAIGLGPGDEVLVPTLTYVATFQAITATGASPISCDVKEETGLLDPEEITRKMNPRVKAILLVHYASYVENLEWYYDFAKRHQIRVVEDAAHAFGCEYEISGRRKKIGSFGDVLCFSFDGIKNITSGEGGAIVTSDPKILDLIRDLRLLAVEKDSDNRYAGKRSWEFEVHHQGWRYHMSDLMAAIGRCQLKRFEHEFKPKRCAIASHYRQRLGHNPRIQFFRTDLETIVPHIQPIRVPASMRDRLRQHLQENAIETGVHYKPNHLLKRYYQSAAQLPVAERLYSELLTLPLHPNLQTSDIDFVCDRVEEFFSKEVHSR